MHIDDPVGAAPVHFANGLWGVVAVGIFASGNPATAAWNGVDTPVTGLLYGGSTQILAQLTQGISIAVFVFVLSFIFFKILNAAKVLRSDPAAEMAGLDLPEMGAPGYTNDDVVMHGGLPGSRLRGAMSTPRSSSTAPVAR
jgi:Amt family ammonium transporter